MNISNSHAYIDTKISFGAKVNNFTDREDSEFLVAQERLYNSTEQR